MREEKNKTKGTQSDLARLLKVSRAAVSDLVKRGVVTLTEDRKVWLEDAVKEYQTKTDVAQRRELESKAGKSDRLAVPSTDYHQARARREVAEATLAELELKEKQKTLLNSA